jgi:6,7-dimethyl-8-ribityllumazine synthase
VSQHSPSEKKFDARGKAFAVVAAQWNPHIVDALLAGAVATLRENGASVAGIHRCAGVFELAPLCARVGRTGGIDGVVALGCVIRGGTDHYALLSAETTRALGALAVELSSLQRPVAVAFGVLTCDNEAQAVERKDKGREAALACLEQALAFAAADSGAGRDANEVGFRAGRDPGEGKA